MVDFNINKYETVKLYNNLNHIKREHLYDKLNIFLSKNITNSLFGLSFILIIVLGITSTITNMLSILLIYWCFVASFNLILIVFKFYLFYYLKDVK